MSARPMSAKGAKGPDLRPSSVAALRSGQEVRAARPLWIDPPPEGAPMSANGAKRPDRNASSFTGADSE